MLIHERIAHLRRLRQIISEHESQILRALESDLGRPSLEAYASEISPLYDEIKTLISLLTSSPSTQSVSTPWWKVAHFLGSSEVERLPVGRVLILSPWNYPFFLSLIPLIGAFAAGNSVVLKPSEHCVESSRVLKELLSRWLSPDWVDVRLGDATVAEELTRQSWGHLFFTGSTNVGKKVMRAAAETLTPVTLELGGKCPVILDDVKYLETALKRIWWGKTFNAGQTCVAPDYLLVPTALKDAVIEKSRTILTQFFGKQALAHPKLSRIVSARHFDRLKGMMAGAKIVAGGESSNESLKIAPTLLEVAQTDHPLWTEEIFGPLLLLQTYASFDEINQYVARNPYPLALYVFTDSDDFEVRVRKLVMSGGFCRNDTLVHLTNPALPFGGVKLSGMGAYHGAKSLETFSHRRSIERKSLAFDMPLRYPTIDLPLSFWTRPFC